ncbi:hypothetical protein QRQ56_39115 [Bradyrhizobium sp. U531]|uniref:hypothetical protein n=1 Tax=Bradyrhizobium sp. U531 TaxID=3053458 RepID=UPI003F42215C
MKKPNISGLLQVLIMMTVVLPLGTFGGWRLWGFFSSAKTSASPPSTTCVIKDTDPVEESDTARLEDETRPMEESDDTALLEGVQENESQDQSGIAELDNEATLDLDENPRPSPLVRLKILERTLEFNKTLLSEKERAFFKRMNRIGLWGNSIPKNGPKNEQLRGWLDKAINTHKSVMLSKEIPRLYFKISLLESAKVKLQDEDQT